jgi:4-hydroxybenzoyl-CoA reductase subunit beta
MHLPRFAHYEPASVDDALGLLTEHPGARLLAGGTDLLVNMKHLVEQPETLVSLSRVDGLRGISDEQGATVIGARTTLKDVQQDARLQERYPALTMAASAVGSYRHQTMGTLAGNLCQNTRCRFFNQTSQWRSARALCYKAGGEHCHVMKKDGVCYSTYCGDVAPALLVLDAQVRVQGTDGTRDLPLADLYTGEGRHPVALAPAEMITAIVLPASSANGRSTYEKHALRGAIDFPIVGAAVWRDDTSVRVAYTAVDRKPVRATALEEAMAGGALDEAAAREVSALATKAATITRTTVQPVPFKRELMATLFVRGIRALA